MTSRAFRVVEMFEEAMAEYAGAPYGVAVDSCSTAIYLSLLYERLNGQVVAIPKHTYISVPHGIVHAGGIIQWDDREWKGAYVLRGTRVVDSALRMRRGMYNATIVSSENGHSRTENVYRPMYCVSFHMRKHIKIGRGGMILTDDHLIAEWMRQMRFDGRIGSIPFTEDRNVQFSGYNAYMLPEQAARGLQLLEALPDMNPDLDLAYPDLSVLPVFQP